MLIYSAVSPLFESEFVTTESISKTENGIPSFYEKNVMGNTVLKFSTDPKMYLKSEKLLQNLSEQ
ncbi:MAG: hypothetical protein IJN12_03935 [Clostridia bacterium]|nr:hypothetical protein [Clostridia bacterium]